MFAILISTKNRKQDLIYTLLQIQSLIDRSDVQTVVFDDGSTDGTFEAVKAQFPQIKLHRNDTSKGYMFCRNSMLNETSADYAISLDDDAHFISEYPLEKIKSHFESNANCGVIAFRIYWGKSLPVQTATDDHSEIVKGFIGCGHCWRVASWRKLPNYPEWFEFYGEEDFGALQLFKKHLEVHYLPEVLVQHRVDLKTRSKSAKDFEFRYRRSIRSGWYLYFLFYPISKIPRKFAYSFWMQLKKIGNGDMNVLIPLLLAVFDVIANIPNLLRHRNALTPREYNDYMQLKDTKIYWNSQK